MREKTNKILKTLCIYMLVISMMLSSLVGSWDVMAAGIEAPTINKVFYDATSISGGKLHRGRINNKPVRGTVHVILKDSSGTEKANLSVTPTSGTTWSVNLPEGVTIVEGDTVTAYQEFDGQQSTETIASAEPSLAYNHKNDLKMPTGEIWIEQTSSNQVNADEQAEAVQLLKDANTAIAGDIKSIKFSIDGTEHAYYEVTYTDDSTSGKVEAPNLTVKQVTEYSRAAVLGSITIVDNVIKGQLAGEGPFDGIKVQIVLKLSDAVKGTYCEKGKCLTDKDTGDPVSATVDGTTGEFSYTIPNPDLKLNQEVGVIVKEPHKFKSCSKTTVIAPIPEKTEVKDPGKLTADDKGKIIEAIKTAYTVDGESKLPNGTGQWAGVPAVIQFDDSGNVKIFRGNDVAGTWDPNNGYKFVPETNADGSYKLKDGAEPKITIQAKDLLKNIKPEKPAVALSKDKKNITITPNEKDTDAKTITVSYKDKDGNDQTTIATKADDGTWSIAGEGTVANGVVTLPKDKVKGDTTVTATVTDKGGIADDDKTPLTSEPGTFTVKETKAEKVEALGGLDPVDIKKWVGDELNWKDGVEASKSASDDNKAKIKEFLDEAKTTFADENSRGTTAEGDFTGKIKVTFDDGSFIEVDKQNLYVSNHVTSMDRKDKVPTDALDVEFKLGEGTKVDNTDGTSITGPNSYQKYKVKPNTNLKEYKIPAINTSVVDSIKVTPQEGYIDPVWRDSKNGTDFVASSENNVFTATATKTFKVTVQANGGTGDDKVETKKSGEKYTLPKGDTFTPPENQKFAGWLVGDATTTTEPGTEITITSDTVIKASWKPIMVDVSFDKGEGSGEKAKVSVAKGSEYTLPNSDGFTPPENQEFAGWEVNGEAKKVGDKITVNENTTVTAKYTPIMVDVSFDKGEGSGSKDKATVAKGSEYTLPDSEGFTPPENQKFAGWVVNGEDKKVGDKITVNENTTVTAKYTPIMVDVSFDKGEGSGEKAKVSVAKGSEYTLPDGKEFTPPENQEFAGWEVNGETKNVGDKITVNENTTAIAKYKPIEYKVTFNGNGGTGTMDPKTFTKGDTYKLPEPTFKAPENKEFDGWLVGTEKKAVGSEITVTGTIELVAQWKDKSTTPGEEPGTEPGTNPNNPNQPGEEPGIKPNPDTQVYNPWWPIWFGTSEVKPAKPAEPKVEYERGLHRKYLYGYKDHTVRPEGLITRAEAAALIARLAELNMSDNSKPNFKDTPSAWYNTAINAVIAKNLMFADKDGDFRPNEPITRGEFARAMFFIDKKNDAVAPFADVKGHVYEEAINQAYGNDRIKGYPDGTFKPDATITRAEAATILNHYADRNVTFKGLVEVHKDVIKFIDLDESHWAYYEIMEAANTHDYQREKGTIPEDWEEILEK